MESINLSKLVLSPHFLTLLEEESIQYDYIISDNKELSQSSNIQLIESHLETFFSQLNRDWDYLIILDKLSIHDVLPHISKLKSVSIINANSSMGSFWKKFHPELDYLSIKDSNTFNYCFPWDLESFLKLLKNKENAIYPLSSQEIADNIYSSSSEDEDWIQFIDKKLIDDSEILSLLSPKNPDLLVIWFWNHFEELVKLSQLLSTNSTRISLSIVNNWNYLFSEEFKEHYKGAKKIAFIMDCKINKDIDMQLSTLWKPTAFITPEFDNLTSMFPEYYFEQTGFNAISLYEKCLNLV